MVLLIVCTLTFIIHFIGTLAYCFRIVNITTQRSAITGSIFNLLMVVSRMATTLQAPLLAKYVETRLLNGQIQDIAYFRYIILASILGSLAGGWMIPTAHRLFSQMVRTMYQFFSITYLFKQSLQLKNWKKIRIYCAIPKRQNWLLLTQYQDIPLKIMFIHMINNSFLTISILSCLLAGHLNPDLRATTISLSGFVSGLAIIGFYLFADPDMAILTDSVLAGEQSEIYYRKYMIFVIVSRITGTILAQFLLVPLAYWVLFMAKNCLF
jgi:hypothetical protein